MQTRRDCVRMGLWEILPSQLSTVQKDHHSPTYWSFSCALLWVIFKTASLLKKTPKPALNLYIQVWQYIYTRAQSWGCSTPRCMAKLSASLLPVQWCGQRESIGCWAWESVSKNKNADPDLRLCWVPQHWGQRPKWELFLWYSWSSSALC